jgi:hypothetical protein
VSEFSESFHLRSDDRAEGVDLLRRARVGGYVFEPRRGWVTVLFPQGAIPGLGDREELVLAANRLLLVHYFYAEDYECGANLYQGQEWVGRAYVSFEGAKPSVFDRAAFVSRGLLTEEAATKIEAWVHVSRDSGNLVLASSLRLPRHELCSFDYEWRNPHPAERVEVDAGGHVVADEEESAEAPWSGAPPEGREDAAFVRLRAFLERLVADGRLELTATGNLDELVEAILRELASAGGSDPTRTIVECLEEDDGVEELYADDDEVRAALARDA